MDGVAASVYIDFLDGEAAAHRSAAKYRLAARFVPRLVRWLHVRGLNQPLLLFMARALPEVRTKRVTPGLRTFRVDVTVICIMKVGPCSVNLNIHWQGYEPAIVPLPEV